MNVLAATDFFPTEVWITVGLVTYYVLFFIHVGQLEDPRCRRDASS
jgi:hypothetical protein